ncbi:hypothetical protein BRC92_03810 [Halobacteriales archaeon QS_4_69_31]|nr:MAG: hypothetical protein BRC92_03810 [Halobacteriales archaeon QS_4_69_31]
MEADDILRERPVLATAAVAAVSALAYVAVQVVLDGVVDPVETAMFVLVFTLVYVGGNRCLRGRAADESAE